MLDPATWVECSTFRVDSMTFLAAEMSVPESGRALVLQEPFFAMVSSVINEAGSEEAHVECCLVQGRQTDIVG